MKARNAIFFGLSVVYAAGLYYLVEWATLPADHSEEAFGYGMRNLVIGCLLATYVFFLLQHFLTGKVDIEYLVIMPVLALIASFLIGAVLHVFGADISASPFRQAGILHLIFSLLIALRLWRHYWLPRKTTGVDEGA
ncbi:hypothetical protein [Flaviaesturariibacter terrae]